MKRSKKIFYVTLATLSAASLTITPRIMAQETSTDAMKSDLQVSSDYTLVTYGAGRYNIGDGLTAIPPFTHIKGNLPDPDQTEIFNRLNSGETISDVISDAYTILEGETFSIGDVIIENCQLEALSCLGYLDNMSGNEHRNQLRNCIAYKVGDATQGGTSANYDGFGITGNCLLDNNAFLGFYVALDMQSLTEENVLRNNLFWGNQWAINTGGGIDGGDVESATPSGQGGNIFSHNRVNLRYEGNQVIPFEGNEWYDYLGDFLVHWNPDGSIDWETTEEKILETMRDKTTLIQPLPAPAIIATEDRLLYLRDTGSPNVDVIPCESDSSLDLTTGLRNSLWENFR